MIKKIVNIVFILILGITSISCEENDGFNLDATGQSNSGSIAKFYVDGDFLYVVESSTLTVFDISDSSNVNEITTLSIGGGVETISKNGPILFLGTTTGVLFYDVSNPFEPQRISEYRHFTACDPVVTDGSFAYSTLRSGVGCGGGEDVLDIIDISNLSEPILINSISMTSPFGLAIEGNNLFVGEGSNGMVWFDVTDKLNVVEIARYEDIDAVDFILRDGHLIIRTLEGILQYGVGDHELNFISGIKYVD